MGYNEGFRSLQLEYNRNKLVDSKNQVSFYKFPWLPRSAHFSTGLIKEGRLAQLGLPAATWSTSMPRTYHRRKRDRNQCGETNPIGDLPIHPLP